ncbi:MAG: DEAD/DEAH box helicase [Alcaligenes sp.]
MTDKTSPTSDTVTFADFGLHPGILSAVLDAGYSKPTPIQAEAIPVVLAGRDVMGAAQTGTGKTAAFSLPILNRLMAHANTSASPARHPVRALVLRSAVVFGGVDIGPQKEALRRGVEIVIATPGRLLDHIEQRTVNLSQVGILVLDEADRMLDMGFLPDLDRIVSLLPKNRQGLLFSATFSKEIRKLARSFLNEPVEIEVAARNATASTVTQLIYPMPADDKRRAVVHLVKTKKLTQTIVFSNTKIGAGQLARYLEREGIRAESIHGNKSQLERMKVLDAFKGGKVDVLVATDVAARGLDVAGVPCVINFDLPYNAEDYVHRIGRTGRAGASGEAIALMSPDEENLLQDIEKLIGSAVPRGRLELPSASAGSRNGRHERGERRSYQPSTPPVDEFFLKPYEPSTAAPAKPAAAVRSNAPRKRSVGVLLGGGRY